MADPGGNVDGDVSEPVVGGENNESPHKSSAGSSLERGEAGGAKAEVAPSIRQPKPGADGLAQGDPRLPDSSLLSNSVGEKGDAVIGEEQGSGNGAEAGEKREALQYDSVIKDLRERQKRAHGCSSNLSLTDHFDFSSVQGTDGSSSFVDSEHVHSQDTTANEGKDLDLPHEGGLYLDELDDDVLYLIASHLEARVVRFALSKVCTRFRHLFDKDSYWRMRVMGRCPKKYPPVESPSDVPWADACTEREDAYRVWANVDAATRHFMFSFDFSGEVDAVHLMKDGKYLVSGDRSRCLNLIDLAKYPETEMRDMITFSDDLTHGGWIWSVTSVGDSVITGCWDKRVRLFDAAAGMAITDTFTMNSAVLSLYAEQNEVVASCFDKAVFFVDRRSHTQRSHVFHSKSVLTVTGDDKYVITGSEDRTIAVFDRTAGKVMETIRLNHYPCCLSYQDNRLWCGDRSGYLHLYDGTGGAFSRVGKYSVGNKRRMTGVVDTLGALYTSMGNTIEILEPTLNPSLISSISVPEKVIARIAYDQGVLVSAVSGGIRIWLPKSWDRDTYLL